MHAFAHRLACERGQALIEGLLALGLVLLTVCFAMKALAYAHARSVAIAVAQEGARAAATGGPACWSRLRRGTPRGGGRTGAGLRATVFEQAEEVTVHVGGKAPLMFLLALPLPAVRADASLPLERCPQAEAAPYQ